MADNTQWEYIVQTCGTTFHAPKDEELQVALNSLGEQSWEAFSVMQLEGSYKVRVVAKRLLTGSVRRRSSWPDQTS
jgi:hypothetical protein